MLHCAILKQSVCGVCVCMCVFYLGATERMHVYPIMQLV